MAWPVVIATNGYGTPVTESDADNATPYEIATNGFGSPVVFVDSGGLPVREGVGGGGPVVPTLFSFHLLNESNSQTITAVSALRVRINGGSWQTLSAASLTVSQPVAGQLQVAGFAGTESSIEWTYEQEQPGEPFNVEGTVSGIYVEAATNIGPANTNLPGMTLAAIPYDSPIVTA